MSDIKPILKALSGFLVLLICLFFIEFFVVPKIGDIYSQSLENTSNNITNDMLNVFNIAILLAILDICLITLVVIISMIVIYKKGFENCCLKKRICSILCIIVGFVLIGLSIYQFNERSVQLSDKAISREELIDKIDANNKDMNLFRKSLEVYKNKNTSNYNKKEYKEQLKTIESMSFDKELLLEKYDGYTIIHWLELILLLIEAVAFTLVYYKALKRDAV